MAAHPFDLNLEPPVLDLNNPAIHWDGISDWDGPEHELVELGIMAREDGDGGNRHGVQEQGVGVASGGGDERAAGQQGKRISWPVCMRFSSFSERSK